MSSVAIESLHGGLDAFRNANFGDRIGAIKAATFVVGGEGDPVLTPAMLREFVVDKIPGARFQALPGVGHYPQIEAPDELTRLLVELTA
jgi:pimeloyl-ACP methyl ester carboxylesterase